MWQHTVMIDLQRNHKAHVSRLKKTRSPEVLTANGKVEWSFRTRPATS
jgi:hypothetical protein